VNNGNDIEFFIGLSMENIVRIAVK